MRQKQKKVNPRPRARAIALVERWPGQTTHEIANDLGWGSSHETHLRDQLLRFEKKGLIYSVAKFGKGGGTKERRWYPVPQLNSAQTAFRLAGLKLASVAKLANPAKGISGRELAIILAKSTPQMRAQIERQLVPADATSRKSGTKKVSGRHAKTSWGKDTVIDRIGRAISKTKLRRALNPSPTQKVKAPTKNLFGFDRASRIKKHKKRTRVASAKASLLEAKDQLKRARKNPKQLPHVFYFELKRKRGAKVRGIVAAASIKQAAQKLNKEYGAENIRSVAVRNPRNLSALTNAGIVQNPMNILEVGSHVATMLMGAQVARELTKKPTNKRRPTARQAGKRLAEKRHQKNPRNGIVEAASGLQAAEYLAKELGLSKRRNGAQRNSAGEIFEDFTGIPSTQVMTGYVAANAPKNVDELTHDVVHLVLVTPNGKPIQIGSERDGTARMVRGEIIRFQPEALKLCAAEQNGKRRFVTTVRAADRAKWVKRNPGLTGNYKRGVVAEVVYRARKPHIYGHNRMLNFYHIVGEEGGRRPTAYLKNGCPSLNYGAWEITAEGIKN